MDKIRDETMIEIAQTYLGNIHRQPELAKLVDTQICLEVCLSNSDRNKGRIYSHTDTGIKVGIIKSRDRSIDSGDLFQTETQKLILVRLPEAELLVLDFTEVADSIAPAKLVYLGHLLGNHHYPIAIEGERIYVQLVSPPQVINQLLQQIEIPGLQISYQTISNNQNLNFATHSH